MKKAKIGLQKSAKKRRRGRPAIGQNYTVRLPGRWIEDIDYWAKESTLTRSQTIRKLIEAGADKLYGPRTRRRKPGDN